MFDLTADFLAVEAGHANWGPAKTTEALRATASQIPACEWEYEGGCEECGRLLVDGQEVAFIHARLPLGLFLKDHRDRLETLVELQDVRRIYFGAWNESAFRVDREVAERLLRSPLPPLMDANALSAWDIWYWFVRSWP